MLTKVILDGPLGKEFGREWELEDIGSATEALRIIDANKPGLFLWIKGNLPTYERYQVLAEFPDGRIEELDNDTYNLQMKPCKLRFVPLVEGGSGVVRAVVGVVMIAVAFFVPGPWSPYLYAMGASLVLGSIIEALMPRPKNDDDKERKDKTSYYFDGPVNTTTQGVPVPLIYGRILTGSHAISASVTIEQMI